MTDTHEQLKELADAQNKATPGPWCWSHVGEKVNGYVIGNALSENEQVLSGRVEWDDIVDTFGERAVLTHEASVVNYADADFIVAARNFDAAAFLAEHKADREKIAELEEFHHANHDLQAKIAALEAENAALRGLADVVLKYRRGEIGPTYALKAVDAELAAIDAAIAEQENSP